MSSLERFLQTLTAPLPYEAVFNPWSEADPHYDLGPESPGVRRDHLVCFLESRLGKARILLIGEALGYQGGHFSGVPLTSERMLLGHDRDRGLDPGLVLPGGRPRRTSRPAVRPLGFAEPTATMVWEAILASGLPAEAFVFWNAFAWHPYRAERGLLSNRKPRATELAGAEPALVQFLDLFPDASRVALGVVAANRLEALGVSHHPLRHPARGGAGRFRQGFQELLDC